VSAPSKARTSKPVGDFWGTQHSRTVQANPLVFLVCGGRSGHCSVTVWLDWGFGARSALGASFVFRHRRGSRKHRALTSCVRRRRTMATGIGATASAARACDLPHAGLRDAVLRALPVRPRLAQRRVGLVATHRREEPAGPSPVHLNRCSCFDVLQVEDRPSNPEVISAFLAPHPHIHRSAAGDWSPSFWTSICPT